MDTDKIQRQAKQILDNFADALAGVEKEAKEEEGVEREDFERKEGDGRIYDSGFKEAFLKNAPSHDEDFVIAETGGWK